MWRHLGDPWALTKSLIPATSNLLSMKGGKEKVFTERSTCKMDPFPAPQYTVLQLSSNDPQMLEIGNERSWIRLFSSFFWACYLTQFRTTYDSQQDQKCKESDQSKQIPSYLSKQTKQWLPPRGIYTREATRSSFLPRTNLEFNGANLKFDDSERLFKPFFKLFFLMSNYDWIYDDNMRQNKNLLYSPESRPREFFKELSRNSFQRSLRRRRLLGWNWKLIWGCGGGDEAWRNTAEFDRFRTSRNSPPSNIALVARKEALEV